MSKHEIGSIAWYAESLARDAVWVLRTIEHTYADPRGEVVCARVNRRLTPETDNGLWETDRAGRPEVRLRVWLADSILWAGEEYAAGHYTHALRGLLQATGYASKLGATHGLDSALINLRNALEAVTEYVVARETDCRCGVRIIECQSDGSMTSHDARLAAKGGN